MNDKEFGSFPSALGQIEEDTRALSFSMASDYHTGSLLRTLAASKPAGHLLELGTGTGLATAWLLDGMDAVSNLTTVETDATLVEVAQRYLASDGRVTFIVGDGAEYLRAGEGGPFDVIFADAWPGKYEHLGRALGLLRVGGIYVIDDMLPQVNWPEGHEGNVQRLIEELEGRSDIVLTKMGWSTGLVLVTKVA